MKSKCDCLNYYNTFNLNLDHFMKMYASFVKMESKKIKLKSEKNAIDQTYESVIDLSSGLALQGEESIEPIKNCKYNHKKELTDLENKVKKLKEYPEKANRVYEKINKLIPDDLEDDEEDEKYNDAINQINGFNQNNKNLTEKEQMENDLKVTVLINDLLKDKEIEMKSNEEKKNLKKVMNSIQDIIKEMKIQVNKDEENIEHVENNVAEGFELVDKGDLELIKAAKHSIERRRAGYTVTLAAAFCAIGTVVPGLGNVIGAALGGLVGYGISKIDERRLKNIEKKYLKEKDKKDK